MTETVYTQDSSTGRIHKRLRDQHNRLLVDERCNLDDAGAHRVLTEAEWAQAVLEDSTRVCAYCFPATEPE